MPTTLHLSRRGFVLSALALAACKPGAALLELTGQTMGTTINVVAVDHESAVEQSALQTAVDQALQTVNAQMSNWDAVSEISRLNAAGVGLHPVSPELEHVLHTAQQVHAQSNGFFDVTLGPVIELWGFGANGERRTPGAAALERAMESVGMGDKLTITKPGIHKANAETTFYLPSIAKGFGVDHVAQAVAGLGLTDFMVEIGGDLYVSGLSPKGAKWQIGIESPDLGATSAFRVASLSNLGMATSGNYRNYFEEGGQRFSHIIDPHTGQPVTHRTASVTVLHQSAMLADAWSTALLAAGSEHGQVIARDQKIAALFIDHDPAAGDTGFTALQSDQFDIIQG